MGIRNYLGRIQEVIGTAGVFSTMPSEYFVWLWLHNYNDQRARK